jgi:hypothetical protein
MADMSWIPEESVVKNEADMDGWCRQVDVGREELV